LKLLKVQSTVCFNVEHILRKFWEEYGRVAQGLCTPILVAISPFHYLNPGLLQFLSGSRIPKSDQLYWFRSVRQVAEVWELWSLLVHMSCSTWCTGARAPREQPK